MNTRALLRRAAAPASTLLILACAELHLPEPGPIVTVRVDPDTLIMRVGDTLTVEAIALDSLNTFRTGALAAWSSSAPGVATVGADGRVTAVSAGGGSIDATVDGVIGDGVLAVSEDPAASGVNAGNNEAAAG